MEFLDRFRQKKKKKKKARLAEKIIYWTEGGPQRSKRPVELATEVRVGAHPSNHSDQRGVRSPLSLRFNWPQREKVRIVRRRMGLVGPAGHDGDQVLGRFEDEDR